jgi:hypothetical protein
MRYTIERKLINLLAVTAILLMGLIATGCWNPFTRWPQAVIAIADDGMPYGTAPFTLTFDISGSYDPDGEIVSFIFEFGDASEPVNGTDITQLLEHTYEEPGSYFAKLTVHDNGGAKGSVMLAIQVSAPAE